MALRTREQQDEYNRKRREESAAKKAAKAKPESVLVVEPPKRGSAEAKVNGKLKALGNAITKKLVRPLAKPDPKPSKGGKAAQSKAVAAKSEAPATPVAKKPTPKPAATDPQETVIHTMPLSYVRNGAPGGGMQRGKNFQATVTFTPEQFNELRDRALFNNRSLAEQIRWCCTQVK